MNLIPNLIILFNFSKFTTCQELETKIINGSEVTPPFKYSWLSTIYRYNEYLCGGILVNSKFVLTAAHCLAGGKAPLNNFQVMLHRHNLTKSFSEENGLTFSIESSLVHPNYDEVNYYNDIAILKLNNISNISSNIQLDDQLTHESGKLATALGWGSTSPGGPTNPILQEVNLPLYNEKDCVETYKSNGYQINTEIQLCAGLKEGGRDSCRGDSGGPLILSNNNQQILVGIISNGNTTCGIKNSPGIYTKVAKYKDWILNNLK